MQLIILLDIPKKIALISLLCISWKYISAAKLLGNIIASASDVEVVNDETVIKLSNEGDSVSVNINNEQRALEDLNGTELKEVCKYFNLKGKGKKIELIERIKDYQINLKNSKNFFVLGN